MSPIDFLPLYFSGLFFLLIEFFDGNQLTFVTSTGPPASAKHSYQEKLKRTKKSFAFFKKVEPNRPTQKSSQ
jgi:hypothetical protein